jgi:cytochrome P450 family 49 subfamily A
MKVGTFQTSNSAATTLYYLAKNPEKQQKLYQEVKSVVIDPQQPIMAHHLDQMKFMKACIKEATRYLFCLILCSILTARKW